MSVSAEEPIYWFLANVNSCEFTFAICHRLSVCLSSVTFVRPSQAVQIVGSISTALGTLAIHWHHENFMEIVPVEPLRRGS